MESVEELRLLLERDLLVDGGRSLGVHVALAPGHLDLLYQGEDDQDHRDVEHQVHDRDPILSNIYYLAFGKAAKDTYVKNLEFLNPEGDTTRHSEDEGDSPDHP